MFASGIALRNTADECLQLVGALTLHAVGHMAVHIQCEGGGGVVQVALHCLNVKAGADGGCAASHDNGRPDGLR